MYNSNYNNFPGNNFTFHPTNVPPPPPPPKFFIPLNPVLRQELSDKDFIQKFECKICPSQREPPKRKIQISQVFDQMQNIFAVIKLLKNETGSLREKISSTSDEEWNSKMEEIEQNKAKINKMLTQLNNLNLNDLKPLLAKRMAKRLRLKRVQMEKKKEKEDKLKEIQERSRKIDEHLQKIKDEVLRAKQEDESKIQADIILKEVLRKKHDAKKCIAKLDALVKLRKARQNTVKGRGESVTESEAKSFNSNIEKLKLLWTQKLAVYEKEESELRRKLEQDSGDTSEAGKDMENEVMRNLVRWRLALFGGTEPPQVDFRGDIARFIAVRAQWDQFINGEGTPIPVGWVPPTVISGDKDTIDP